MKNTIEEMEDRTEKISQKTVRPHTHKDKQLENKNVFLKITDQSKSYEFHKKVEK